MRLDDISGVLQIGGRIARRSWVTERALRREHGADGVIDVTAGLPMRWQPTVSDLAADDWRVVEDAAATVGE